MTPPYPLLLRPMLFPKVWGGSRLARLNKPVKPGEMIGESWEVADLASTSTSGAGGSAARSIIENGPLRGKTLHDALALWPAELIGSGSTPAFPLLVKYLDARENLSVQVHPSPAFAAFHPGANLKSECWFVLDAEPGAKIHKGIKPGVTRSAFERALRAGDGRGVLELIDAVPAVPGECHNLPSGTVHALGAGVLVAEVQTPSDTTFRVYDWGRAGRALHVDEALACIAWEPAPPASRAGVVGRSRLVATDFFTLDAWGLSPGESAVLPARVLVLMALKGEATLAFPGQPDLAIRAGQTLVVPTPPASAGGAAPMLRAHQVPFQCLVVCPIITSSASF